MTADDRPDSVGTFKAFAIAEGILLIILGVLALIFPVIASVWVTGVIAVVFLVGGVVGWISNLARSKRMGRWICFWRLVVSTLFIVAGASMISNFRSPAEAAGAGRNAVASDRNRLSCGGCCGLFQRPLSQQPSWSGLGDCQWSDHLHPWATDRDSEVLGLALGAGRTGRHQLPVQRHRSDRLQLNHSQRSRSTSCCMITAQSAS